jgi:hypothetical protein
VGEHLAGGQKNGSENIELNLLPLCFRSEVDGQAATLKADPVYSKKLPP